MKIYETFHANKKNIFVFQVIMKILLIAFLLLLCYKYKIIINKYKYITI